MIIALLSAALAAPVPLTYQGRLVDPSGVPVDSASNVTIVLHGAADRGDPLWSHTYLVDPQQGYFTVVLTPDAALFDGADRWVETRLPGQATAPLVPLGVVPYAVHALSGGGTTPSIVHRTAADFSAMTLTGVSIQTEPQGVILRATPLEVGNGEDGDLVVDGTTLVDDGTPKQYASVVVRNGGVVRAAAWNGTSGGTLDWQVSGPVSIDATSRIDATGRGYSGGPVKTIGGGTSGDDGRSPSGSGNSDYARNGGGGGAGPANSTSLSGGGGGGGYGSAGEDGSPANAGSNPRGQGGATYGTADLSTLYLGAGGGSGSTDNNGSGSRQVSGGAGGGAIRIVADSIVVASGGRIEADGAAGGDTICLSGTCGSSDDGGGGGGAGGSIHLRAIDLDLSGTVTAVGGARGRGNHDGNASTTYYGGAGGVGRIRVDAANLVGTTTPAAGHTEDLSGLATTSTITSAPIDGGAGAHWWHVTVDRGGNGVVALQARSSDDPGMVGATDWASVPYLGNGQSLVGVSSVTDGHRYLQYRVALGATPDAAPEVYAVVVDRR